MPATRNSAAGHDFRRPFLQVRFAASSINAADASVAVNEENGGNTGYAIKAVSDVSAAKQDFVFDFHVPNEALYVCPGFAFAPSVNAEDHEPIGAMLFGQPT